MEAPCQPATANGVTTDIRRISSRLETLCKPPISDDTESIKLESLESTNPTKISAETPAELALLKAGASKVV
ncbi:MAG: hypothetical protein Ct9H300mP19_18080 [Dehalococcoidia bacterium]|nr:MAG: hypothetical protein Ct9H300mP19_18080 [Dehalococcoidia bacterium]